MSLSSCDSKYGSWALAMSMREREEDAGVRESSREGTKVRSASTTDSIEVSAWSLLWSLLRWAEREFGEFFWSMM